MLRFRRFPVAIVCDIAEMCLRIWISNADKPYHKFLWKGPHQNRTPDVYEFDRVVFGENSSPFQAQFVLQQHAKKYKESFRMAAETIEKSTCMDDSMDSVHSEEKGIELHHQLSVLLSKAGMHARKWLSNSSSVLSEIPLEYRKAEVDLDRSRLPCIKTLGVWWLADQDVFSFKETAPDSSMSYIKRKFLKKIATLLDPIGCLAPFTISSSRAWFGELCELKNVKVPRCLWSKGVIADTMSLHTFVDASESAYGAVVNALCQYDDG